jgi:hypothetical protein
MNLIQYGVGSHPALYITKKGALALNNIEINTKERQLFHNSEKGDNVFYFCN